MKRSRPITRGLGALVLLLTSVAAMASNALLEIREEHWFEAMTIGRVDSEILYAIALQESGTSFNGMREYGPWPWVMNITELDCTEHHCMEQPKFFSSREATRRVLKKEVEKGNRQIAVGMWQIHLRYNAHYVEDPLDLVDPVTNLYVAAMVLRGCGDTYATTRDVLSCYYSGNVDEAGIKYAERVLKLANKWGMPFRLKGRPDGIQFTYDETTKPAPPIVVRTVVEPPAERTMPMRENPISLALLAKTAKPLETASHTAFMEQLEERGVASAHRVIVVD